MTVEENKRFSPAELHLIMNRLGQSSFNSEGREFVGKDLAEQKLNGTAITDPVIAESIGKYLAKVDFEDRSPDKGISTRKVNQIRI